MTETTAAVEDEKYSFATGQLKSIVERVERLEEEKKNTSEDIKQVFSEAKANGFDTKVLKKIIALRRKSEEARTEEASMIDLYMSALGMIPAEEEESDV